MCKQENLKKIRDLLRCCGETEFRAAVQHLFDTGNQNFSDDNVNETKVEIQKNTKPNAIMTADFQCALLDCCLALSKLPDWDVLLYVKLYMSIDGDDTLLQEEAERAVRSWRSELGPQTGRDACAGPELCSEIVQELVDQHTDHFSSEEIKAAVLVLPKLPHKLDCIIKASGLLLGAFMCS